MNDDFRDLKERLRRLDAVLAGHGTTDAGFAQAISRARRATKRGDRSRPPPPELRALLEQAEMLARRLG
jgi:hypothetical protein